MKKIKLDIIFIILITIIAFSIRTFRLEELPVGVNVDEAGMAYDAFCISNFKVDRALNHLPVYFINFGGGQSVLYGYITSVLIGLFGFKLFNIRITAVIFFTLSIIMCFFMFRKHIDKVSAVIIAILLTINPWHIMASRWGLDCNLFAPCTMFCLFFLLRCDGKWQDYVIAGTVIGITLYTYALSYAIMPIFLFLILCYMLYTKKINFKNIIILGIPIFILALPLILMILVNNGILNQINFIITIPKLPWYRGTEISLSNVLINITSLKNILIYDNLPFNSVPQFGTLYNFAIIFTILGFFIETYHFIVNIKNKKFTMNSAFFLLFVSEFCFFMFIRDLNISKANAIYFPFIFFGYSFIYTLYKLQIRNKDEEKNIKKEIRIWGIRIVLIAIAILYLIHFALFLKYYFVEYEKEYGETIFFERDLVTVLYQVNGREELKDKVVYIYTDAEQPYIYTLFANPISPYEFNDSRDIYNNYGRYKITDERKVNELAVYIMRRDTDFSYELVANNGFNHEDIGEYILLYK